MIAQKVVTAKEEAEAHAREWAHNAKLWIERANMYGLDMLSSRESCLKDAQSCLDRALKALKFEEQQQFHANVRLIAEMLEALKLAMGAISPGCAVTLDRIKKVIAKAEGVN